LDGAKRPKRVVQHCGDSFGLAIRVSYVPNLRNFNNLCNIRSPDVVATGYLIMPALFVRKASDADA
jgi:hypothetical protein